MTTSNVHSEDTARQQLAALTEFQRQIEAARLPTHQSPAERTQKSEQLRVKAEVDGVRAGMALSGTLAVIAKEIGFGACPLDRNALRGALLGVLDSANNPDAVSQFYARDAKYLVSKQKANRGVRVSVPIAAPTPEIRKEATALRLRFNGLAGGFEGRVALDSIVQFARIFDQTIRTQLEGETVELLSKGKVDEEVMARLRGQAASLPSADGEDNQVQEVDDTVEEVGDEADAYSASSAPDDATPDVAGDPEELPDEELTAPRSAAPRTGFNRVGLRNTGAGTA